MANVLIMIDSFKGTLDSHKLGKTMQQVLAQYQIQSDYFSISDGGEGFYDAIKQHLPLKKVFIEITTLDAQKQAAYYYSNNQTAYIEVAQYIGFKGFNKAKNPLQYTSRAIGEIIKDSHQKGFKHIIIGLGGSLTNDFGLGLLEVLGVRFYNEREMTFVTPDQITDIQSVDISALTTYQDMKITILSDVVNPLFGKQGATYVFGIQKGLTEAQLPLMEASGKHLYNLLIKAGLKDTKDEPGAGASGGLGNILKSVFKTETLSGLDYLLNLMNFDQLVTNYDHIITGEGKIDIQSLSGKVVFEVAKRSDKPVTLVCALSTITLEAAQSQQPNIKNLFAIVPSIASREASFKKPKKYFTKLAHHVAANAFVVK